MSHKNRKPHPSDSDDDAYDRGARGSACNGYLQHKTEIGGLLPAASHRDTDHRK